MSRPTVEVADLLRTHGDRFLAENRSWLSYQQLKVLRAIERCRTPALGGHFDHCSGCGHSAISFNSCRNRHCPKCQAQARQRWLACREQELLGLSLCCVRDYVTLQAKILLWRPSAPIPGTHNYRHFKNAIRLLS